MGKKVPRSSPSPSLSTGNETVSNKTVSTTGSQFGAHVRQNGVLDHDILMPPTNLKDIVLCLERKRDSPDPGQTEFTDYDRDIKSAPNETAIVFAVISGVLKKSRDPLYRSYPNQQFANFPTDVGFNNGLSAARPDWIEGYLKSAYDKDSVVEQLSGAAVQSQGNYPIVLAHLAGEFNKRGGDMACASDQAAYDAAYLVYGRDHAQVLMHKVDESGMAYVGSFVCDGSRLQISVHYATKHITTGVTEYRQYLMFDENIQMNLQHFIDGRRRLRNLQDWSRCNANLIRVPSSHYNQGPACSTERRNPTESAKVKQPTKPRNRATAMLGDRDDQRAACSTERRNPQRACKGKAVYKTTK